MLKCTCEAELADRVPRSSFHLDGGQWCSGGGATGAIAPVPGSLVSRQFCLHLAEIGIVIKLLLGNYL